MNIIKSDLVSSEYDVLWQDIGQIVKNATPKPVMVLINTYPPGSPDETQLLKMLEVSKLSPEQYNIVQIEKNTPVAWHKLRDQLDPKVVFLIGILPAQLGISSLFKLNAPNHFNDRIWLATLSLGELEQFPDVKKQLWTNGMKPIFVDKVFSEFEMKEKDKTEYFI